MLLHGKQVAFGIGGYVGTLEAYPEDMFDKVMAINASGVFLRMKLAIPLLRASKGNVINIPSISGLGGGTGVFADTAMIRELAETRMPGDPDAFAREFAARLPMGCYGGPGEVAAAAAFLASPAASFISGAVHSA